jgi:LGFP repeat-containing protein
MTMSEISTKYAAVFPSHPGMGTPVGGEQTCGDTVGRYQEYSGGASIYYSPATGAHLLYGKIRDKFISLGREAGPNGYPTSDETDTATHTGRMNTFQHGAIYYHWQRFEAFSVHGEIYSKWHSNGLEGGVLGYPISDETGSNDGVGRLNFFENGVVIYHATHGTHVVLSPLADAWKIAGRETGPWGYPTAERTGSDAGATGQWVQAFTGGTYTADKMISYGLGLKAPLSVAREDGHVRLRKTADGTIVRDFQSIALGKYIRLRTLLVVFRESYTRRFTPGEIVDMESSYAVGLMHMENASFGKLRCEHTCVIVDDYLAKSDFKDEKNDNDPNTFEAVFDAYPKAKSALASRGYNFNAYNVISIGYPWKSDATNLGPRGQAWTFKADNWGNSTTWTTTHPYRDAKYWWALYVHEHFHTIHGTLSAAAFPALPNPDDAFWNDNFAKHWAITANQPSINESELGEYLLYAIYGYVHDHWLDLPPGLGTAYQPASGHEAWGTVLIPDCTDAKSLVLTSWRVHK